MLYRAMLRKACHEHPNNARLPEVRQSRHFNAKWVEKCHCDLQLLPSDLGKWGDIQAAALRELTRVIKESLKDVNVI